MHKPNNASDAMQLNADTSLRVVLSTADMPWVDSPHPGVRRKLLARDGGEVARATSLVAYAPGASFASHRHDLGEEILVLEGHLQDEHGAYGPGTYLKNPPGSSHAPRSDSGCLLFVKLRHLAPTDTERVVLDTRTAPWRPGLVKGLTVLPLSSHGTAHAALVRWAPQTRFSAHRHWGGEEILVLDGVFEDEHGSYPSGTWLRSPHLSEHRPFSTSGCTLFVKTGHLRTDIA